MKKLLLVLLWLPATLFVIILAYLMFLWQFSTKAIVKAAEEPLIAEKELVDANPTVLGAYDSNIITADARPEIVSRFLAKYDSPQKPYDHFGREYVRLADEHNLDFRLLPAIAMQESNVCKKIPENSFNCWGYGIYGDQVVRFNSYEEGMDRVAETLAKNYSRKGLLEPEEIMGKYTPQSKGSWAEGVIHFMNEMR